MFLRALLGIFERSLVLLAASLESPWRLELVVTKSVEFIKFHKVKRALRSILRLLLTNRIIAIFV